MARVGSGAKGPGSAPPPSHDRPFKRMPWPWMPDGAHQGPSGGGNFLKNVAVLGSLWHAGFL